MSVYFIRHGQSEFNAAYESGKPDPIIIDAPLTKKGEQQAKSLRKSISNLDIKHVVTSPLTRAIQTSLLLFENKVPIEVKAGHHELLLHSCDIGRSPKHLKADFPELDFSELAENWWHHKNYKTSQIVPEPIEKFKERIRRFIIDIEEITLKPLAVVGHGNAFKEILGIHLENCEVHRYSKASKIYLRRQ